MNQLAVWSIMRESVMIWRERYQQLMMKTYLGWRNIMGEGRHTKSFKYWVSKHPWKKIPLYAMVAQFCVKMDGFLPWPVGDLLMSYENSCENVVMEQVQGSWAVLEFKSYLGLLNFYFKPERGNRSSQEQAFQNGNKIYCMKKPGYLTCKHHIRKTLYSYRPGAQVEWGGCYT